MKVLTNIIKFILMIILTISMISIGIITIISSTILDKNYVTEKLEETDFYKQTYELVVSNFENYIYQSGLDENVLENICTEEKVKQDLNIILSNIYEGTDKKIDTTEISEKLNKNIDDSGIKTSKNKDAIDKFVQHITEEYTDTLIHTKYENKINQYYTKIINILNKINNISIITFIVTIILIIIINKAKVSKILRNIGIALLATGMFNIVANQIILSKVNVAGIKIFNDTFSNSIVTIIQDILTKILNIGIGAIVVSILFLGIYVASQLIKKDNEQEQT